MNYYAVLGVAEDASFESIHNAFRALARQYHPDAGEGSSAGKFRELVEAYETLSDSARRYAYDAGLARHRAPTPKRHAPTPQVVVEPLTQPWFESTQPYFAAPSRPVAPPFRRVPVVDDWFEEVFRSFEMLFWR